MGASLFQEKQEFDQETLPVAVDRGNAERKPLSETGFASYLSHERQRAERSGRTIGLLLVDCSGIVEGRQGQARCATVMEALCGLLRLTDIVGWRQQNATAGVILTEFGNCAPPDALERVQYRMTAELSTTIGEPYAKTLRISGRLFPEPVDLSSLTRRMDLTFYPELYEGKGPQSIRGTLKRVLDVTGSTAALVLGLPILAAIALAVRLTSRGPVIYRQERIGQFGKPFTIYKFRTMHFHADAGIHEAYVRCFIAGGGDQNASSGIYKIEQDPRVTRLGKFMRKTSLDELPQFLNVLYGDMSLVGPRPPLLYELEAYQPWHRRRVLEAKPGLTGLWQVAGRSKMRFDDMVRLDLRYAKKWSLALDFTLLAKTFRVFLSDEGAC